MVGFGKLAARSESPWTLGRQRWFRKTNDLAKKGRRAYLKVAFSKVRMQLGERAAFFVHVGNALALFGATQTDVLSLRMFMISATACGITFNLLQPKPLFAPACWGVFFLAVHGYQILKLLQERRVVQLTQKEEDLYNKAFMQFKFTPRLFLDVLNKSDARWRSFPEGGVIQARGEPMPAVHYLLSGNVSVFNGTNGHVVDLEPGSGAWLGEFYDPNYDLKVVHEINEEASPVTYKCASKNCRTVRFCRATLQKFISGNPRLANAAVRAEVDDLWAKIRTSRSQQPKQTYKAMLNVAVSDGRIDPQERCMLRAFGKRQGITVTEHEAMLASVGWTPKEFEKGYKSATPYFILQQKQRTALRSMRRSSRVAQAHI
eukprot:jgi/Bigna1/135160/aug1.28_g9868